MVLTTYTSNFQKIAKKINHYPDALRLQKGLLSENAVFKFLQDCKIPCLPKSASCPFDILVDWCGRPKFIEVKSFDIDAAWKNILTFTTNELSLAKTFSDSYLVILYDASERKSYLFNPYHLKEFANKTKTTGRLHPIRINKNRISALVELTEKNCEQVLHEIFTR